MLGFALPKAELISVIHLYEHHAGVVPAVRKAVVQYNRSRADPPSSRDDPLSGRANADGKGRPLRHYIQFHKGYARSIGDATHVNGVAPGLQRHQESRIITGGMQVESSDPSRD